MFMPQMEGEMPGENYCRGLTYKSHAVTAAHTHTHPETFTGRHTHKPKGRHREKTAPLRGLPLPSDRPTSPWLIHLEACGI